MTGPMPGGRRRIDRVLADDFLASIETVDLDRIREMRHEADQEDADLSYIRRLLQGRIDIIEAELRRRSPGSDGGSIVDHLAEILADENRGAPHGMGRHLTVEPSRVDEHRREVEKLVADSVISDVGARTDQELAEALERLRAHEREVSGVRRRVQEVADRLTAELGGRYRDGKADVTSILPREA
jgi:hypothetical protein